MTVKWPIILLFGDRLTAEETVVGRVFYLSTLDATVKDNAIIWQPFSESVFRWHNIMEYMNTPICVHNWTQNTNLSGILSQWVSVPCAIILCYALKPYWIPTESWFTHMRLHGEAIQETSLVGEICNGQRLDNRCFQSFNPHTSGPFSNGQG